MLTPTQCAHTELMPTLFDKDPITGTLKIECYRCVDCGKEIDANKTKITLFPPSKEYRRRFALTEKEVTHEEKFS